MSSVFILITRELFWAPAAACRRLLIQMTLGGSDAWREATLFRTKVKPEIPTEPH